MATTLQESRTARFGTLCTLYFSQGIPWFFVATALVTFLVDENAMTDDEKLYSSQWVCYHGLSGN